MDVDWKGEDNKERGRAKTGRGEENPNKPFLSTKVRIGSKTIAVTVTAATSKAETFYKVGGTNAKRYSMPAEKTTGKPQILPD
jgi:hypothetical protein